MLHCSNLDDATALSMAYFRGALLQTDFAILVQDYAPNGDLYTFLHKLRYKFSERKIVQGILMPCMDALAYLHARNIAHRDIKPENLLLDADNIVMLADFGLSVCLSDESAVTRAGTMDYMAPEVLVCPLKRLPTDYKDRKDIAYSVKVDSWSIGVLAFELIAGRTPFRHKNEDDMLKTIKTTEIKFPSNMSTLARDWIQRAMTFNVQDRASMQELITHPWITSNISHPSSANPRMRTNNEVPRSTSSPIPGSMQQQQTGAHPESVVRSLLLIWVQTELMNLLISSWHYSLACLSTNPVVFLVLTVLASARSDCPRGCRVQLQHVRNRDVPPLCSETKLEHMQLRWRFVVPFLKTAVWLRNLAYPRHPPLGPTRSCSTSQLISSLPCSGRSETSLMCVRISSCGAVVGELCPEQSWWVEQVRAALGWLRVCSL